MNVDGPAASRRVVFAVGDRVDEAAAAWRWATSNFLEPKRDQLTLLHIHTGGVAALVRLARARARAARAPLRAQQENARVSEAHRDTC
jgi:hypothetical protein